MEPTYVTTGQTQSATGVDGNSYTTAVSNDQLTNEDFMKLLIEELKMQDPTKPMDTTAMMDNQLKMSTIDSQLEMSKSLEALTKAYQSSSVSNAVSLMNRTIEDGSINEDTDSINAFKVQTVESLDGEVYVNALKALGFSHSIIKVEYDDEGQISNSLPLKYNKDGEILDSENEKTGYKLNVSKLGKLESDEDGYKIFDQDGQRVTDKEVLKQFQIGSPSVVYSSSTSRIAVNDITKVY